MPNSPQKTNYCLEKKGRKMTAKVHPNHYEGATLDEMMLYWSQGHSIKEVADHFGKSEKVIAHMVARYKYLYERSFNFPHILHAKRFGA